MKKELKRCLGIAKSWKRGEGLSFEEIYTLAYTDIRKLKGKDWLAINNTLMSALHTYGKEWDEYDEEFPNNPYRFGYVLEGHVFVTGYTGIAGHYWTDDTGMLCDDE